MKLMSASKRQPEAKTIENTLFNALVEAGAVSQDNANDPVKVRPLSFFYTFSYWVIGQPKQGRTDGCWRACGWQRRFH
jgi:tRNA U38,U39,U40 pseudouridine synthase TruA